MTIGKKKLQTKNKMLITSGIALGILASTSYACPPEATKGKSKAMQVTKHSDRNSFTDSKHHAKNQIPTETQTVPQAKRGEYDQFDKIMEERLTQMRKLMDENITAFEKRFFHGRPFGITRLHPHMSDVQRIENDHEILYKIKLKDFNLEEIEVSLENSLLTVQADRKEYDQPSDRSGQSVRQAHSYRKSFSLNEKIDASGMQIKKEGDFLIIQFPKKLT